MVCVHDTDCIKTPCDSVICTVIIVYLDDAVQCIGSYCCSIIYKTPCDSVKGELGVGEFGVVRKGVWSVGSEEREVAVKSLADGSTEEKRIQFLQEAVIMSQFTHPNVITLYGVLLEEKHVSIPC